jgi:hypothetical protein
MTCGPRCTAGICLGGCAGGVPSCELAQLRFIEHRLQELRNPQAMLTKASSTNDLAQRVR